MREPRPRRAPGLVISLSATAADWGSSATIARLVLTASLLSAAAVCCGCGGESQRSGSVRAPLECDGTPDPGHPTEWDSILSELVVATGSANHSAPDSVINPEAEATIRGKFTYGPTSADLAGEAVVVFQCSDGEWEQIGVAQTDDDGRIEVTVPGSEFPAPGRYRFYAFVRGDSSSVSGSVYVTDLGTDAVVFDIDGTLTTSDSEAVEEIVANEDPELYAGAPDVVDYWVGEGALAVYLTGRFYGLERSTRAWLERHGFAPGPLFTTDSLEQWTSDVENYKYSRLVDLRDRPGLSVGRAYGNASTDICAYARAGIDPSNTYIIGPNAGESCPGHAATVTVSDYPTHLAELER